MDHITTPAEHANAAAEALRALNHATLPGRHGSAEGLSYPSHAYDTVGALVRLVGCLPQTTDQIHHFLGDLHGDPQLTADTGTAGRHLSGAQLALRDAAREADQLYHALNRAWSALSPLGYRL